jgi:putative NIF3 family GTP cyclohydrolase 1 type 2
MNTDEIMQIALDLVGFSEIPGDSAIYVPGGNIRRVAIGVDMGAPELLLARQIGAQCVIAHHPAGGTAFSRYHEVIRKHIDLMVNAGVPHAAAEEALQHLLQKTSVLMHKKNHDHNPSVARFLGMPYMNVHNPCDELGRRIMHDTIQAHLHKDSTLQDVVRALMTLPEFQHAHTQIAIRVGKPETPAGRVVVVHGAGTNGGASVANAYFDHGIHTVIYIHIDPEELDKLRRAAKGNLIITGHIASDAIGLNPFIRALQNKGLEVIRMSGL